MNPAGGRAVILAQFRNQPPLWEAFVSQLFQIKFEVSVKTNRHFLRYYLLQQLNKLAKLPVQRVSC